MTPSPVEGIVLRYLEHLRLRNMAATTVYSRHRALARLRQWAGGEILYLDGGRLAEWQRDTSRRITPQAMRAEMSHARQFYRWAVREGFRDDDPTARLDLPRVARGVPRPMTDERFGSALAGAPEDVRIMLALAGYAGLRAIEIARLDWREVDITSTHPTIRIVHGKGGHGRLVPVSSALKRVLADAPTHRGPVIRYRNGSAGHVPAHWVSARANEYLHAAGIEDTLHSLRHRFATSAYRASQDIRAVQQLLGHASPTTTSIYAAASSASVAAAVEAAGALDIAA